MEVIIWKSFLAWVRKVPLWVWAALAIVIGVWCYGNNRYNDGQASVQGEFDAYKKVVQEAVQRQRASNLAKEAADRAAFKQIAEQHAKDIKDAKAKADRIAADLRAGNIKLRKQWRGCAAPQATTNPEGTDEDSRLREESAGRIIGNATEADSWIRALQDVVRQLQKQQK